MNNLEDKIMRDKLQKQDEEDQRRRLEATKYQVSIDYDLDIRNSVFHDVFVFATHCIKLFMPDF